MELHRRQNITRLKERTHRESEFDGYEHDLTDELGLQQYTGVRPEWNDGIDTPGRRELGVDRSERRENGTERRRQSQQQFTPVRDHQLLVRREELERN
jgi:hypothetical protein